MNEYKKLNHCHIDNSVIHMNQLLWSKYSKYPPPRNNLPSFTVKIRNKVIYISNYMEKTLANAIKMKNNMFRT